MNRFYLRTVNRAALVAACLGSLTITAGLASATTLLRMSLVQMAHSARAIVRARCVSSAPQWDGGEIWTFTTFETQEVWRGSLSSQFTVRLLGGRMGNLTSSISGVPRFAAGEEVVLFLEATRRGDFSIVGWEEGTFRIRRDSRAGDDTVTEGSAHVSTFNPITRQFEAGGIEREPLRVFRARIAAMLGAQTGGMQ